MPSTEELVNKILRRWDAVQANRRQKIVDALNSLLRDPDAALVLPEILHTGELDLAPDESAARSREGAHEEQGQRRRRNLRESIRQLTGQLPARFTIAEVTQKLKEQQFSFKRSDPEKSVRDALYKLQDGALRVVEEGKGGRPNVYEFVKKPGKSPTG